MKKAVISCSGGLDSTCLLLKLLAEGYEVRAYGFQYGQKHQVELRKVKRNIKFLQEKGLPVTYQCIDLKDAFSDSASSLRGSNNLEIPQGDYRDESMKSTVVENRNIIFSSIVYGKALGWANKTQEDVIISLGIHAGDHTIYPDCRPESQEAAKHLFSISNWGSERVDYVAPFVEKTKGEVLADGLAAMKSLGFTNAEVKRVLRNTHSCYSPDEHGHACGKCGTCVERLEAFAANNMKDPAKYSE